MKIRIEKNISYIINNMIDNDQIISLNYKKLCLSTKEERRVIDDKVVEKQCIFRLSEIDNEYLLSISIFDDNKYLKEFFLNKIDLEQMKVYIFNDYFFFENYKELNNILKINYNIDLDKKYNQIIRDKIIAEITIQKFAAN